MKRKIIIMTIVASSVVSFAVLNVSNHPENIKFTDISLDNIEALAQESDESNCVPVRGVCYNKIISVEYLKFQ